jgi:hypothetical protein
MKNMGKILSLSTEIEFPKHRDQIFLVIKTRECHQLGFPFVIMHDS